MAIVSVSGMAIVSTIVGSGGISLRFGISGSFVELRDTISGSRSGNVLVASAGGIVGSKSSISVSIRITISIRVAIGTSIVNSGISISLRFGISRSFVELRDTIGGSRGGNVLVASAGGIVRSES